MNLADVFTVVFIILGFLMVFVAYWLMAAGLFPEFVERCSEQIGIAPIKTSFIGAVTLGPLVAIGFAISSAAPNGGLKLIGLAVVSVSLLVALFGSAGLALRIGAGLKSEADAHLPWRRVLRGGNVLALSFVMPFLGQFLMMPFAFVAGFGAFLMGVFKRRRLAIPAIAPLIMPVAGSEP
ncbi:MAG: hypothetical protein JWL90_1127 [Chthoniobacteraceae bacterium]|nr:hypothetical protein [Chthoniobacteraceae bacterium]